MLSFHKPVRFGRGRSDEKSDPGIRSCLGVYVATVFRLDHRGETASGRPVISQRRYVCTRLSIADLMRQLHRQAIDCGSGSGRPRYRRRGHVDLECRQRPFPRRPLPARCRLRLIVQPEMPNDAGLPRSRHSDLLAISPAHCMVAKCQTLCPRICPWPEHASQAAPLAFQLPDADFVWLKPSPRTVRLAGAVGS
jgi:hypothetical protein